jgi:hypothetical protein
MATEALVKVITLLAAAVLFLIAAFVDDPRTELGLGLCLVAVALVIESVPAFMAHVSKMGDKSSAAPPAQPPAA